MVSSQIIGVEPVHAGISSAQEMFSVSLQVIGSPVSLVVPSRLGPRHWGQFSAEGELSALTLLVLTAKMATPATMNERIVSPNVFLTG